MAIYKEQRRLARKESGFRQAKLQSDYDAYKSQLATQYGLSTKDLNSNLEARGILNSGEAGTARTTAAATNEAAGLTAKSDFDYNTGIEKINLTKQLAALKAGTAAPAATQPKDTAAAAAAAAAAAEAARLAASGASPTGAGSQPGFNVSSILKPGYKFGQAPTAKKVIIKPPTAKFR